MKTMEVSVPQLAFVAATRGVAGAGVGLLVSNLLSRETRNALGWTLLAIGALTTIPIAARVFSAQSQGDRPVLH